MLRFYVHCLSCSILIRQTYFSHLSRSVSNLYVDCYVVFQIHIT